MTISCSKCPLRQRDSFKNLSTRELEFMKNFKMGELQIEAGSPVILEGSNSPHFHTVLTGVSIREKTLSDGRRQTTNFVFPGDLVGVQAGLLGEMKHDVEATTDMVFCVFSRERLWELFKSHPAPAYDITWLAATEVRSISKALLSAGRRIARERVAALFAFLMRRAIESGFAKDDHTMSFPFRQSLRRDKLIQLEDGELNVPYLEALREVAQSDDKPDEDGRPLL